MLLQKINGTTSRWNKGKEHPEAYWESLAPLRRDDLADNQSMFCHVFSTKPTLMVFYLQVQKFDNIFSKYKE